MHDDNQEGAGERRNRNGQWLPGVSGNRSGRPRQRPERPQSLNEEIAMAMSEKVAVTDARGKQRMVPVQTAVAQQLVRSLTTLPTDKLIRAIDQLHKLQALGIGEEQRSEASRLTPEERAQAVGELIRDALEQRNQERGQQSEGAADKNLSGALGPSLSSTAGGASAEVATS